MMLQGAPLKIEGISPMGIVDMELARTVSRANVVYGAWLPAIIPVAIKNTLIDFIFIIAYGSFLYACCISIAKWQRRFYTIGVWFSRAMLVAVFFDVVENILLFRTLSGYIHKEIVASTFMFASAKFLLVALGLLFIVLSLLTSLIPHRRLQT